MINESSELNVLFIELYAATSPVPIRVCVANGGDVVLFWYKLKVMLSKFDKNGVV